MTLEQINSLTLLDTWQQLLSFMIIFPEGENYSVDKTIEGTWYEQLVFPEGISKPTLAQFEEALELHKQSLIAQYTPIWEEEARVQLLTSTFNSLYEKDNGMPSFRKIWPEVSNPLAFFNENKSNPEFDFKFAEILAEEELSIKNSQVSSLYQTMNSEVYAKMEEVFGTKNPESATANQATWSLMVQYPDSFIGALGFTTPEEVRSYANTKLSAAISYGIWRLNRIKQFQEEKAAILA